ncbi:MAG: ECF transporter S component [Candidatus Delongbacteria bacterium]|nr:ECF transporter S component [Candidatus Delongbacteria bacterium]MBN2835232.1 ECF transporter S component [Candidatus Delongbacteria bacterium]
MKKLNVSELVFITVLSGAMGVAWWGYTFIYDLIQPFLKPIGMDHLGEGVWLMGAIFFPFIIRKPGSALLGEMIAATVQGFIAKWGAISILYGFVQGLPVELLFLAYGYKKWSGLQLVLAGVLSSIASFSLTYFLYGYNEFSVGFIALKLVSFMISGAMIGGYGSKFLATKLQKTGVLNQYLISEST